MMQPSHVRGNVVVKFPFLLSNTEFAMLGLLLFSTSLALRNAAFFLPIEVATTRACLFFYCVVARLQRYCIWTLFDKEG